MAEEAGVARATKVRAVKAKAAEEAKVVVVETKVSGEARVVDLPGRTGRAVLQIMQTNMASLSGALGGERLLYIETPGGYIQVPESQIARPPR